MKSNEDLRRDVQDAIKWEPLLSTSEIGVNAKEGVVTLTGIVDSFRKKSEAEDTAKNVAGVKEVVEKIEIRLGIFGQRDDHEIADEVLKAFKWNWEIPDQKVKIKVEEGWVTMDGELQWNYQKDAANQSVKSITGVKGVTNNITIKSVILEDIEQKEIENALNRNWSIDDEDIQVKVSGNSVTLNGTVHSVYEKNEAGRIAWNAPGVGNVDNDLLIE